MSSFIICLHINRIYDILITGLKIYFVTSYFRSPNKIKSNLKKEVSMEKTDKTIVCKDCGAEFTFTVGEQEFYESKGFTNEPVRCKECRDKRKQERLNNNYDNRN